MKKTVGAIWWEDLLNIPFKEENTITIMGVNLIIPFPHHTLDVAGDRTITYATGVTLPISSSHRSLFMFKEFAGGFVGENMKLEEYKSFTEEEKMEIESILLEKNRDWLERRFQESNDAWIAVIDGEVKESSSDIDKYPDVPALLKICENNGGKFPFIFENPRFLMIEEGSSAWSKTVYENDYYPTATIQIGSSEPILGDFDTGSSEIYVDMALTTSPLPEEPLKKSVHLNREFWYYRRRFSVGITLEKGSIKTEKDFTVLCVQNWGTSPFVEINSLRSVLVGRRLFQKLQAIVLLNFWDKKTKIL